MATFWKLAFLFLHAGLCVSSDDLDERERLWLWSRGAFDLESFQGDPRMNAASLEHLRHGPISYVRTEAIMNMDNPFCEVTGYCAIRGGSQEAMDTSGDRLQAKIDTLAKRFGQEFVDAIEKNNADHVADCQKSCEIYTCIERGDSIPSFETIMNQTSIRSLSMGPVPPEDFADEFGFPLDIIKVTQESPLFSSEEARDVISAAEREGVDKNEFESGKYKLAGDWLVNLPKTRDWFNSRLRSTFFPILAHLFPEVVSGPHTLRAHSVSLLKYNSSHPRTDVHIDNGILALTVAMTPQTDYDGGGTYFEHMGVDNVLHMDVGHATFRPGSVRHGGHRVSSGTRYILGAFLLLEDKVEHVRRLKNRGSELRRAQDLTGAAQHFEWALGMNPKCTTCLKDWAEILHTEKKYAAAESKIREALRLLENKDSDALFTLGVILSEQGRDEESIDAYQQSIALNAEDAELCYNLGIKLGSLGRVKEEMTMYAKATRVDPNFGGAWLNWGTALAEQGNFDDAEVMFLKALGSSDEVRPKAMMNLGLVYVTKSTSMAQSGDLNGAMKAVREAVKHVDSARPILMEMQSSNDVAKYIKQYTPLRLQCHKLVGQIHASLGDMAACEQEFRLATQKFPSEVGAWQMLGRVLEIQGKTEEMKAVVDAVMALKSRP